jgi:hypothetical protein
MNRERVYAEAKAENPGRWTGSARNWKRNEEVHLNRRTDSKKDVRNAVAI